MAVWRGDRAFAHRMADLSFRYLNWWLTARGDPKTGLVTAVFEETFPPYLGWAGECASPGTCAEVAHGAELTANLYCRLGETARAETCRDAARRLYAAARAHLWDAAAAQFLLDFSVSGMIHFGHNFGIEGKTGGFMFQSEEGMPRYVECNGIESYV